MARHGASRSWLARGSPGWAGVLALGTAGLALAASQLPGTPLTTDPANHLRPAWSPDGTLIAFQSSRSGNNDIWLMNADGANQHALTHDPADDRRPAWSPDGAGLAFDTDRTGARDIWVMDAGGGEARQLTDTPAQETFPAWSPDGAQIAYYSYEGGAVDLWVINLKDFLSGGAAGEPQRVVNNLADERQNQCTFACHTPGWSPDGTQLAFSAMNQTQIWVVGAAGGEPRRVTAGGATEHFPTWTADGKILFLSERITDQQEHVNDILVMDADGRNAAVLFAGVPHGGPLEFRPDGVTIAFQSPRAGNFDIYSTILGQGPVAVEAPEATGFESVVIVPTAPPEAAVADPAASPVADPAATPLAQATASGNLGLLVAVAVAVVGGGLVTLFIWRRGRP